MGFKKGFKKSCGKSVVNTAQFSTLESENKPLYPSPFIQQNVSGSDKVASFTGVKPPMESKTGLKSVSKPSRVTTEMSTYGAPKGAVGVTGVSNTKPFQAALGKFGRKPHMGVKSITRLTRGM